MAQEEKKTKRLGESRREAWLMLLMVGSSILLYGLLRLGGNVPELPYSEFLARVDRGGVADVVIGDNRIFFESKDLADSRQKLFSTVPVNDPGLPARLQEQHVSFRQQPHSGLGGWLSWALVFFGLYFLIGSFRTGGGGQFRSLLGLTQAKARVYVEHSIKTTFADVAGVDEAKAELNEIAQFLADPERYTRLGGRAPRGILLVGPPGTGKTLLARALAGEAKVPFLSINGSEFVEMFVGLGAARVRDLFEQARKLAPCLLFIDEIDALGRTRMAALPGSNDEKEQTLNQLLAEMDGFDTSAGIIILAATNRPETLDPALLRAGRFDRQVLVNTPDQAGRTHILRVHCRGIVLGQNVSLERIASLTSGFSGADLANLVNEAALLAARRGADAVSETDFTMAVERIVAGLEQRSKHISAEEKRRVAYHEMGHATVALALHSQEHVHKVSVIPRGIGALGYTLQRPTEDRYLMDEDEMLHKIAVLLGGRASEHAFFPTVSTGGADDLTKATEMSRAMVTQYGMSEELGLATFEDRGAPYLSPAGYVTRRPISEEIALQIDHEVKRTLDQAFRMATQAVWQYRTFIEAGVLRLLESETISEEELSVLWQRFAEPRGPSASVGNSPAAKCSAEAPS